MRSIFDRPLILLALCSALALTACGGSDDDGRSVADSAKETMQEAKDAAKSAADDMADAASDAMDSAKDAADDAMDAAGDAMDSAADAASDAMDSAKDMADDAMDSAKDMADDAMDAAKDAAAAAAGAVGLDDDPCTLLVTVGDGISYSTNELNVPASCSEVTLTLNHEGSLPKEAMGHNWVLMAEGDVNDVANAGMTAGPSGGYLPAGDSRVLAATKLIGGGESDTITFSTGGLDAGTKYAYVCTFPGHWTIMRGTFTIG